MRVLIVARAAIGPVELFDLAVQQGVTAIVDLRQQPGTVPIPLRHIYQQPPLRLTDRCVERLLQPRPCGTRGSTPPAAHGDCDQVLLVLVDQDRASEVHALIAHLNPHAQIDNV